MGDISLDFEFFDSKSSAAALLDVEHLIDGSQQECMEPLTPATFRKHEFGWFVQDDATGLVIGYAACKKVFEGMVMYQKPEGPSTSFRKEPIAMIGGLYLAPAYRGRGLARQLISEITNRTFVSHPEIFACVAKCNAASAPVFGANGYQAIGVMEGLEAGRILYQRRRADHVAEDKAAQDEIE